MSKFAHSSDEMIKIEADQLKIERHYDPKPIPIRDFDWCAYIDPERCCGYGKTEVEAINNLMGQIE
jgi:hypothetical protein